MVWDNWIEMNSYFMRYHEVKKVKLEKDLDGRPCENPNGGYATSLLVQDDLVLVIENEESPIERRTVDHIKELDGPYHLDAAAVCLPGSAIPGEMQRVQRHAAFRGWRVPHYVVKLQKSMIRFLKALTPERPVERNNFFIQLDDGHHWSHRMGYGTAGVDRQRDPFSIRATDLTTSTPFEGHVTVRTYFEPISKIVKAFSSHDAWPR
ncbi:uncharacterized protein P174DRAFT_449119 [Aspergillus novofumigatus IBT 16806]|uniref:Uncharacterized protein n=1 Tax=Aspergillus novofumigatus (strain IBT 16806) TaxID=1392255 RepID=A0A2I1CIT5_ASPN1|nr:uncharacterized protein P174DRAFT_449119 [Aspergillus novofumigatus IBT 16806]PKX97507.1 hypothetical protein P174DRAFT_449119 [Aspergillus novofumigatus IBT 16806]